MASYAFQEYPHNTMGSTSANDFTLFPAYDWPQDQTFIPTTYQDQAFLQSTTFDSSFSQPAFSNPQLEQYQFNDVQHFHQKHAPKQPLSPGQSPAHSGTSFEQQQQHRFLSSVSDSGASAHSTISSVTASPSVVPQAHGDWVQAQELGFYPGIVQQDETFATTGLDFDAIPVMDTKGCVGEFNDISSSRPGQDISSLSFHLPNAMPPVDSTQTSSLTQLSPVVPMPMSVLDGLSSRLSNKADSMSPRDSVFKSPSTPASSSPRATTSPVFTRSQPRAGSRMAQPVMSGSFAGHPQAPRPVFSSPFFSQSSGSFLPPLDFSCLSLNSPFLFLL